MLMSIEIDKNRYKSIASTEPYWKIRISYAEGFRYDFGITFVRPASQKILLCAAPVVQQTDNLFPLRYGHEAKYFTFFAKR